jgi:TatD DNase family protein
MLDCHVHLDRYESPDEIVREARQKDVAIVAVTNLPSHFQIGLPHVRLMSKVWLALGLHPLASEAHDKELQLFRDSLSLTSFVGEVGLDFSRAGKASRDIQIRSFRFIAEMIANKVVSLHSRGAESAVLDTLTEYGISRAIFHWYSGPFSLLDEILSHGHYFSVNPSMIRSQHGKKTIERIPLDRILTESDGPHVKIGALPARPWDVALVEEHLAHTRNIDRQEVLARVWSNFQSILHHSGK